MTEQTSEDAVVIQAPQAFLEVRDLRIHFPTDDGLVKSVDGLSFGLERGRTLGIVGESGSGKSVTSLGLLGLHNRQERQGLRRDLAGRPGDRRRRRRTRCGACAAGRWR